MPRKSKNNSVHSLKKELKNSREQIKERKFLSEETLQKKFIYETTISRLKDENKLLRLREEASRSKEEALIIENRELRKWKNFVVPVDPNFSHFKRASFEKYYCFLTIWNNKTITEKDIIDLESSRSNIYKKNLLQDLWEKIHTFLVCNSDLETPIATKIENINLASSKNVEIKRLDDFISFMKKNIKTDTESEIEKCCNMWFKETYNLMINTEYTKD
ncbi:1347_t:CDS:2 [Dentiscutata erythropus]|uniref:1347_t:CDS:1 n=1 Tax=Dentiscutata erythropus TaxID=1348616 RepID=A0A9N8VTR6_9GLOM|nr:1347_t:CDS:2 [Dentiscutata erythropus]